MKTLAVELALVVAHPLGRAVGLELELWGCCWIWSCCAAPTSSSSAGGASAGYVSGGDAGAEGGALALSLELVMEL